MTSKSKPTKGRKPEKIQHPDSRVAAQHVRRAARKDRLADLRSKAKSKAATRLEFYSFIQSRLPPDSTYLSLPEIHAILAVWVSRHGAEISLEQTARRKGRPKSAKETKLEEVQLREVENYKTGVEIPDLTDRDMLQKFRQWDMKSLGYAHTLRFIRVSSLQQDMAVVSRPPTATGHEANDDEAPQLLDDQMDET
ncbi:hypothetical protein MIND_00344800 [Mycena indigotica]|uniref:Translation machinery-associated protein 16 n=1 Tax=Mycena indigotica TaxID=2126181 RepID=A0A8H6T5D9_9AGAR|nr:uncharacterized protein MIND_00344800 [Mycena indigotica]KAF7309730.1 hypothetical protein MIND_00344800 [Mycena indigotica]